MTRAEDDYRRQFLTDASDFPPPPREYWVMIFDEEIYEEWRFAYDPSIHELPRPTLRVAVVAGVVGETDGTIERGVEETVTKGARPPGINWVRHECFFTIDLNAALADGLERRAGREPSDQKCIGSDPTCSGVEQHFHLWVAWRRVEVNYTEMFDEPAEFEEWAKQARKQADEYKRSRLKLVHSEKDEER